jgi:hypothetical protein
MDSRTADDFAPHIGKIFQPLGSQIALLLAAVEQSAPGFTLLFQGPPGQILPPGMHDFQLEDGVGFCFYVMPIHTPVAGRQDYQAVFN